MGEADARGKKNWVLGVTALASFMMALDALVITTAFATIRGDLGASVETLQWTVNAYTLTFAVLLLTGAALGDRFGGRRLFVIGMGTLLAGSIAAALPPSATALSLPHAFQGIGGAIVTPLTLTILSAAVPREKR